MEEKNTNLRRNDGQKKKNMPETAEKQERRKEGTWEKVHPTNHMEIAHMLLRSLRDGW